MAVERAVLRHRWLASLPVLVALLFTLGTATIRQGSVEASAGERPAVMLAAPTVQGHLTAIGTRPDARAAANQGRAAAPLMAPGRTGQLVAAHRGHDLMGAAAPAPPARYRGDANRGRGPPARV